MYLYGMYDLVLRKPLHWIADQKHMSIIKSTKYMEKQALLTLHHACGLCMEEWICADRPDLQNLRENHGIEVVRDCYAAEQESICHIEEIWGLPIRQVKEKRLAAFRRAGVSLSESDGIINGASLLTTPRTPEHLLDTIWDKVRKLNSDHYSGFSSLDLYVFVDTTFIDRSFCSNVDSVLEAIAQWNVPRMFDTLYLDQTYVLCVCDLRDSKFRHIDLAPQMRTLIRIGTEGKRHC